MRKCEFTFSVSIDTRIELAIEVEKLIAIAVARVILELISTWARFLRYGELKVVALNLLDFTVLT